MGATRGSVHPGPISYLGEKIIHVGKDTTHLGEEIIDLVEGVTHLGDEITSHDDITPQGTTNEPGILAVHCNLPHTPVPCH